MLTIEQIIEEAKKAREKAYAPYSNFKVGAVIECKDGKLFYGANVENASYGLTVCAERNAIFKAVIDGYRADDFVKICLITDSDTLASPCGACRQVISEFFNKDTPIIIATIKGEKLITNIEELLPYGFSGGNL